MTGGLADLAERGLAARCIAAMEQHRRPPGGQLPRDGLAEPIGRTGDENDLVGNWSHWFTPHVHPCPFELYLAPHCQGADGSSHQDRAKTRLSQSGVRRKRRAFTAIVRSEVARIPCWTGAPISP